MIFTMKQISGGASVLALDQEPRPLLIGERLNSKGSKRAEALMIKENYDGLLALAKKQIEDGAHALDINVDSNDINEIPTIIKLVQKLNYNVGVPLVLDSNDPNILKEAIPYVAGRPLLNSINLETTERFDSIASIMKQYGVPSVALCIGARGMAKTPDDKLKVAEEIYQYGKQYGLDESSYVFDALTFPIAAGEPESGIATLEGIKLIKKRFPNSRTVLGVSNISMTFPPAARKRINSVFLYHAIQAGLDMAIINVGEILPYNSIPQDTRTMIEDMIFNRKPDQDIPLKIQKHFLGVADDDAKKSLNEIDPNWPPGQKIEFQIINQIPENIAQHTLEAVIAAGDNHDGAISVLENFMLPAMQKVGDLFGSGELLLSSVLLSAQCMKTATTELEKHLDKKANETKGTLVIGTVFGDVHDIGKNLTKTIVENNGWNVIDLGRQVTRDSFLKAAKQHNADAVGLSALLVNSSKEMIRFIDYARENKLDLPILCGGAAINTNFINRAAKSDNGIYDKAFYCRDMFAGLNTLEALKKDHDGTIKNRHAELKSWKEKKYTRMQKSSNIKPFKTLIPNIKLNDVQHVDLDITKVWEFLDTKELFGVQWGIIGKNAKRERERHSPILKRLQTETLELFHPYGAYGFFECNVVKESLFINGLEFEFPRSINGPCLADYFAPTSIVALQAVTVGKEIGKYVGELNDKNEYAEANYVSGLAAQSAEATAAYVNKEIEKHWGLKKTTRYSWGYPICPDHMQHRLVWQLLQPKNLELTEYGQIIPEQSTAAIVTSHPDADYFLM